MGRKKTTKNFMLHGMILGGASIISRLIGLAYRVPLNNILGNEALSDYGNAYNIYAFLLMLSSLSVPLAVSKMVSSRCAKKEYKSSYIIFKHALLFSFTVGLFFGLVTFFGAGFIAGLMGYGDGITPALKALSPALVVMSVLGVFRGYFQGLGTMIPTALSNIFEQITNAVVSIVGAIYLTGYGMKLYEQSKIEESMVHSYGAAGGTLGTVFGAMVALVFMLFVFIVYKKVLNKQIRSDVYSKEEKSIDIIKILVITILPVIVSTTIYNVTNLLDSALFGNIMSLKGMIVSERKILNGAYSAYYVLLINVPVSLASALASSTVPAIIGSFAKSDIKNVFKKTGYAIRLVMMVAIPCAVGYFALAEPILQLLFGDCDGSLELASNMLKLGSSTVVFYSLSTITGGILQGIDKMRVPVTNSAISLVIHTVLLAAGLYFFDFNIYTVVVMNIVFSAMICILNIRAIYIHLGFKAEIIKTFVMPVSAAVIMGAVGFGVYKLFMKLNLGNALSCIIAILACMIVYGILAILFKIVSEEEISSLPMGHKIVRVAKKLRLFY